MLKSFILIFLAEMGDKTQIMAMTFATKYKVRQILIGVAIGAGLNHGIAIALGSLIMKKIPFNYVFALAGAIFILFGILSLQVENEEVEEKKSRFGGVVTVAMAFFVGELGDKTQLAALTLASSSQYPAFILAGTVSGMVFTSLIGIIVGKKFGSKIPEFKLKIGASVVFIIFGFEKLISSKLFSGTYAMFFIIFAVSVLYYMKYKKYRAEFIEVRETAYLKQAERLKKHFVRMKNQIDGICLGQGICASCDGSNCSVGYIKKLINNILEGNISQFNPVEIENLIVKDFDKTKARGLLKYINEMESEVEDKKIIDVLEEVKAVIQRIL